jgi:peptidoglycan/LPS O-acetylase OafA/YrhL
MFMNEGIRNRFMLQTDYIDECVERVFGRESRKYLMGIAMIWILLFHVFFGSTTSGINTPWWIELFDRATIGVDILFVLSTFGLQASIRKNTVLHFYLNRIKRLFPVYAIFLMVLFATFERDCPFSRMLIQGVYQITGLSLFKYPEFFSCNFCFDWFTPAIILLYVFFPVLSFVSRWLNQKGLVYEMLLIASLVFLGVWIRENKHFMFGLLAIRAPLIYLILIIYIYLKRYEYQRVLTLSFFSACLGLVSGYEAMALSLMTPIMLIVFSLSRFSLPFKRIVCLIGKYSYEVYLAHIFAVAFFIPMKIVTNVFLLLLITVFSTIIIASIFAYLQKKFYIWL